MHSVCSVRTAKYLPSGPPAQLISSYVLFKSLSTELQWHEWTQDDLTALILAFVDTREKLAHTLAKAFYIFDPVSKGVYLF